MEPISVIVLAGGASTRMGTNKALLPITPSERLVDRVVANLRPLSGDVVLVSNSPDLYAGLPVRHVCDTYRGAGPLAGLHAGLLAANHLWAFAAACDMPLVNLRLVRHMVQSREGHDAVVPRIAFALEPLHALYSRACLPAIESRLRAAQRQVFSFFPDVRVRYFEAKEIAACDPAGHSFANANTPDDWKKLKALLAR